MIQKLAKSKILVPRSITSDEYLKIKIRINPYSEIDYICSENVDGDFIVFTICTRMFYYTNLFDFDVQLKESSEIEEILEDGIKIIHLSHIVEVIHIKSNNAVLLELTHQDGEKFEFWNNMIASKIKAMREEQEFSVLNFFKKAKLFFSNKKNKECAKDGVFVADESF